MGLNLDEQMFKLSITAGKGALQLLLKSSISITQLIIDVAKEYQKLKQQNNNNLENVSQKIDFSSIGKTKEVDLNKSNIQEYKNNIKEMLPISKDDCASNELAKIELFNNLGGLINTNFVFGKENNRYCMYGTCKDIEKIPIKNVEKAVEILGKLQRDSMQNTFDKAQEHSDKKQKTKDIAVGLNKNSLQISSNSQSYRSL